jgi:hypothetical protein
MRSADPKLPTIIAQWQALLSTLVARESSVRTDPLDRVKRRAYLIATLSDLPAVLSVWIFMGPDGFVANTIFSLFVLYISISGRGPECADKPPARPRAEKLAVH